MNDRRRLTVGETKRMEPVACIWCGTIDDASSQIAEAGEVDDRAPGPGDCISCLTCGEFSILGDDGKPRKPTDEETLMLGTDPRIRAFRNAWSRLKAAQAAASAEPQTRAPDSSPSAAQTKT
jgi:hypothetical protein